MDLVTFHGGCQCYGIRFVFELGRMHADRHQYVRVLFLKRAQLVQHVQAVDAAEGPKIQQHDLAAQGLEVKGFPARVEPAAALQFGGPDPVLGTYGFAHQRPSSLVFGSVCPAESVVGGRSALLRSACAVVDAWGRPGCLGGAVRHFGIAVSEPGKHIVVSTEIGVVIPVGRTINPSGLPLVRSRPQDSHTDCHQQRGNFADTPTPRHRPVAGPPMADGPQARPRLPK